MSGLVGLIVVLIIIGVLLYLVNQLIPMDPKIKMIVNIIIVLAVCLWLLHWVGLLDNGFRLGRIR